MKEKQWDAKVSEAWNTLKEGAENQGEAAREKLTDAYHTVREWLCSTGESEDSEIVQFLDEMSTP